MIGDGVQGLPSPLATFLDVLVDPGFDGFDLVGDERPHSLGEVGGPW